MDNVGGNGLAKQRDGCPKGTAWEQKANSRLPSSARGNAGQGHALLVRASNGIRHQIWHKSEEKVAGENVELRSFTFLCHANNCHQLREGGEQGVTLYPLWKGNKLLSKKNCRI